MGLVAWVCLSVGLTLGGLWAYELGWGGYWAWDSGKCCVHAWLTVRLSSTRFRFKNGAVFSRFGICPDRHHVCLTLGTMMTRSESSNPCTHLRSQISAISFIPVRHLSNFRRSHLLSLESTGSKAGLESVVSREFALINNWVLLFAAFMVTFATLFPSLFKAVTSSEINVGPAFYNLWMIPSGSAPFIDRNWPSFVLEEVDGENYLQSICRTAPSGSSLSVELYFCLSTSMVHQPSSRHLTCRLVRATLQ